MDSDFARVSCYTWEQKKRRASDFDGAAADGTAYTRQFSGNYSHRIFKGIGHNVPQEAPQAFAQAVVDVDGY